MKSVEVRVPLCAQDHPSILCKVLNSTQLQAFHGPETIIGPWMHGNVRHVQFDVDSSGSPILLGSRVTAQITQRYDGRVVRNSLSLKNAPNLLSIESSWHIEHQHLIARAEISVHVPPPLSWLAERFVARKATKQMTDFAHSILQR